MFLRSIHVRGFKSFADKTVLDFIPGVSVVVGPNGAGKSNLVDAIAWVLGEQGARALRGGQMADVIFAGTPSRPALGMAEVKLVIDNEAGRIDVPMTEIEISRTIFRSGESEYRIGGQVVRLLDVQELLSETGIGRALHTVVGQGQLEEVLLARPEERRKYIEEAAILRGRVAILADNNGYTLLAMLLNGADGTMVGISNIGTHLWIQLWNAVQRGDFKDAVELTNTRLVPLMDCFIRDLGRTPASFVARVKEALAMMGHIPCAAVRQPEPAVTEEQREQIRKALSAAGLLA